jgi:hypothetical protein
MNNEPVAWAIKSDGDFTEIGWDDEVLYEVEEWYTAQGWQYEYIPLYTHPVKELTDEEIEEVAVINLGHSMGLLNWMGFARAILRKAQEQ